MELKEKIAKALYEADVDESRYYEDVKFHYRELAEAILPIIEAEVKAEREENRKEMKDFMECEGYDTEMAGL